MPKKKLTKAQVKRKLKSMGNLVYDLAIDKIGHIDSKVPISSKVLLEYQQKFGRAFMRIK